MIEGLSWSLIVEPLVSFATTEALKKAKTEADKFLNPSELEKALKAGIQEAETEENKLQPPSKLFYSSKPSGIGGVGYFLSEFFQNNRVIEELTKPLINEGFPSINNLVADFKVIAENYKELKPTEDRIEPWIKNFICSYFRALPIYESRFKARQQEYFTKLENRFRDVQFVGIDVKGQEEEKLEKLSQIFVIPDLDKKDSSDGKLRANQLLNKEHCPQLVILGEPGSGKSMLIAYFVTKLVQKQPQEIGLENDKDWLPIPINIRDLAKQPKINLLKYMEDFANNNLSIENLPNGFFEYWLSVGEALILLDGLDEVTNIRKRQEFSDKIKTFIQDKKYLQNRIIITSRPVGYDKKIFGTDNLPHYSILRFDDEKIKLFIDQWHNEKRFPDTSERKKCKEALKEALDLTEISSASTQKKRIKLLASNPLLLTIIALVHRYEAKELPQQRHKIYDSAVDTLLSVRDIAMGIATNQEKLENLQYLRVDDLKRLMERIAYWVHTENKEKNNNASIIINRESMEEQLKIEIQNLKKTSIELYQAKVEAQRLLDYISKRTGLLNEQGQDCYAFVHLTFQEYLCAKEIDYQADNEDDFEIVLNHIREHLSEANWQEVILLLIALQKPKKAARAIRKILDFGSENNNKKQNNLLFAASCLAENPHNLLSQDEELPKIILTDLIELEINKTGSVTEEIRSQVFQAICDLRQTDFQKLAFKMLEEKENDLDPERLKQYQAILGTGN